MAMTPEEYERFKEAEKEHLRALKKLKERARQARRQGSVNKALADMAGAIGDRDDPLDVHNEMLDKLQMDTARQEARLEIAMESAALKQAQEEAAEPAAPSPEETEEEMIKQRAQTLLAQMKLQMGLETPDTEDAPTPEKSIGKHDPPASEAKPSPPSDRPDKTIGRMK